MRVQRSRSNCAQGGEPGNEASHVVLYQFNWDYSNGLIYRLHCKQIEACTQMILKTVRYNEKQRGVGWGFHLQFEHPHHWTVTERVTE